MGAVARSEPRGRVQQGEGFARKLYEHADAEHGLLHVPAWGRTWEGEQFAAAMGGETMDDEQAAAILGLDLADMMAYGQE